MTQRDEYFESRLKKLHELKDAGIEPYAKVFDRQHTARELLEAHEQTDAEALDNDPVTCSVAGRIMAFRGFGKAAFAHVQDATGRIQVYLKKAFASRRNIIMDRSGRIIDDWVPTFVIHFCP